MNLQEQLQDAIDLVPHPDPVGSTRHAVRKAQRRRRSLAITLALLVPIAAVAALVRGTGQDPADTASAVDVPTCGAPPRSTGPHVGVVHVELSIPRSIRERGILYARTSLTSSRTLDFMTTGATLTVLQNGEIVGHTMVVEQPLLDFGLVPGTTSDGPGAALKLLQCPEGQVEEFEVPALPPGEYEVIATIPDLDQSGRVTSGLLVSEPQPLSIEAP
ncbi:MAG: hypothetical protein JWP14_2515 [Frankiales bacterium]|nr:hypothetical protein [Frankiales bacterium]